MICTKTIREHKKVDKRKGEIAEIKDVINTFTRYIPHMPSKVIQLLLIRN